MAKLPTAENLGGMPSARSGRPIATYDVPDLSIEGRGLAAFGQGVAQLGGAIGEVADERDRFRTERAWQEFQWNEKLAFDKAQREMTPEAVDGFSQQWQQGYLERARGFFSGVPQHLRPEYEGRLFQVEQGLYGRALDFQRTEQKRKAGNELRDTAENVWLPRAASLASDKVDELVADAHKLIDANPYMTPSEKEEAKRSASAKIASAHLEGLTLDERIQVLTEELAWPEAFKAIDHKKRAEILEKAEAEREKLEQRAEKDNVTKTGYELMVTNKLTPEWLEAHRDVLNPSDYRMFLRDLAGISDVRKTNPETYLRLFDLTEHDPEAAQSELRTLYLNNQIAKDDFQRLFNRAARQIQGPRKYDSELRQYVRRRLEPPQGILRSPGDVAKQLDALYQFDDWLAENPKATRDEMRTFAESLIEDFSKIIYQENVMQFPLPRFIDKPRDQLTAEDLRGAATKLVEELQAGRITQTELTEQAAIIRRWVAILERQGTK